MIVCSKMKIYRESHEIFSLNFELGIFDLREQWRGEIKGELASTNHDADEKQWIIFSSTFKTARGRPEQPQANPPAKLFPTKNVRLKFQIIKDFLNSIIIMYIYNVPKLIQKYIHFCFNSLHNSLLAYFFVK